MKRAKPMGQARQKDELGEGRARVGGQDGPQRGKERVQSQEGPQAVLGQEGKFMGVAQVHHAQEDVFLHCRGDRVEMHETCKGGKTGGITDQRAIRGLVAHGLQ